MTNDDARATGPKVQRYDMRACVYHANGLDRPGKPEAYEVATPGGRFVEWTDHAAALAAAEAKLAKCVEAMEGMVQLCNNSNPTGLAATLFVQLRTALAAVKKEAQ